MALAATGAANQTAGGWGQFHDDTPFPFQAKNFGALTAIIAGEKIPACEL